ncbi:hypothetical protein E2C01_020476 [Portunus trituberculatus]|uniref:Uncharacterized protein n=1 Tax=Portunus trituberculatus TaxID=210409 RepID=A0A5B7E0K0_PORTR|nr:hypothetical protein [Portunus trituberculatus]
MILKTSCRLSTGVAKYPTRRLRRRGLWTPKSNVKDSWWEADGAGSRAGITQPLVLMHTPVPDVILTPPSRLTWHAKDAGTFVCQPGPSLSGQPGVWGGRSWLALGEKVVVCRPVRAISPGSLRSGGSSALPCEITPARPRTCIRVVSGYLQKISGGIKH